MTVFKLAPALLLQSGGALPALAPARPGEQRPAEPATADDAALAAFVGKYCVSCHGPAQQKGKFRLDTLAGPVAGRPGDDWSGVLDRLEAGDMPPKEVKARRTRPKRNAS